MIRETLRGIEGIRETARIPCRTACAGLRIPPSSYFRWKKREKDHTPLLISPGPKKLEPLDIGILEAEILKLGHRRKLSYGSGRLYRRHSASISRRELMELIRRAREEISRERRNNLTQIRWHLPNLAWAMDDLECGHRDPEGGKLYGNRLQDLSSRYKFPPLAGEFPCGEEIAGYLDAHFQRYGPPLLLKRDNRGNLNHSAVNDILGEYLVIPLNSPEYYAPYNGGIEKSQGEFQGVLQKKLSPETACPRKHIQAYAEAAEHDLNHLPRPCLGGKTSCWVYFEGKDRRRFTRRERRDIYDWIKGTAGDILGGMGDAGPRAAKAAWRTAVETWLVRNGMITVTRKKKVSPYFFENRSHN